MKLSVRSLRRDFGCYCAARVPAQVLQKRMRHADIKTMMSYHANVDQAAEQAVRERPRNTTSDSPPVSQRDSPPNP